MAPSRNWRAVQEEGYITTKAGPVFVTSLFHLSPYPYFTLSIFFLSLIHYYNIYIGKIPAGADPFAAAFADTFAATNHTKNKQFGRFG